MADTVDDLFDVPLDGFVAARDDLAKRLKAEGRTDEAADMRRLRKPTVTQWVAEQMRRRRPDAVDALRQASSDVAAAQEAAIVSGDRDALRAATRKRREAASALGDAVDEVLARDGWAPKHRDQVLRNLEAGITAEVAPGPLGLRDDLELPDLPTRPAKRPPARDRMAERRAAQTRAAIEAAERRVQRARDELERAETELGGLLERERAEPS